MAGSLFALPACTTLALEDTVPQQAPAAFARPTQPDGYPNLNVPTEAASPQLGEAERQRLVDELTAVRQRQAAGPNANAAQIEAERLRLLARLHAERRLREIEEQQPEP